MGVISSRNAWTSETHFQHPQTGVSVLLTAVLQHQAGWSPRGGRHRFGSAASGELQRPRLKCRTVIICPENGSFLGEDCAGWCRGSGWWKRQAARDAGAACRRALHRGPGSRPPRVPLSSRSAQVTVPFSLQEVSPWPLSPTTDTETVRDWGPPWCFPLSQQRGPPPSGEHVWTRVIAFGAEPLGGVALGSRPATGSCCPEMETE